MTANTCVRCGRPTPDGYACSGCSCRAADQLRTIADMTPAARMIAYGQGRSGSGGASGKPESRMELNLAAAQRLDSVQNALSTLVREISDARGIEVPTAGDRDPIAVSAGALAGHVEWMRHAVDSDREPFAVRAFAEIEACARIVAGIARGPSAQKYLGPCGAQLWTPSPHDGDLIAVDAPCDGDIYAREGAQDGACRTCGATVGVDARRAWLDGEVRSHAFRASEIEDAYGVKANLIRQWATPERGLVAVHGHDRDGRALYLLSQVLDVAAEQKAKLAERQAKRARRAATRTEGDAA